MQELIDRTQQYCNGTVRLKLYKVTPAARPALGMGSGAAAGRGLSRPRLENRCLGGLPTLLAPL